VETGALVHEPTVTELGGWRVRRVLLGLGLIAVGVLGTYLGAKGLEGGGSAGDGTGAVTILTIGASVLIGYFGVRYLTLGLVGRGLRLYERAVEADFFSGPAVLPRRRTVPLLRVQLTGSSRLASGQAITTTGHAYRLPAALVEEADLWYLSSLGVRPMAPGGREAKGRYERGEMGRYPKETRPARPDHGPAWRDAGTLPITVEVEVEAGESAKPAPPPPVVPRAPREHTAPRSPVEPAAPMPAPPTPRPAVTPPPVPPTRREEAEMEVLVDVPEPPPPAPTPGARLPPPPRVRPPPTSIRAPPPVRPAREEAPPGSKPVEGEAIAPGPEPPELEEIAPVPPAPATAPASEWELEEVTPPEAGEKKVGGATPSPGSDWEWEEM